MKNKINAKMYLMVDKQKLSDWIIAEMNERSWSQSDLARAAGIERAIISKIVNQSTDPTPDTLTSIARAFKLPPETVFRAAGLLPKTNQISEKLEQAYHALASLDEADLETIIAVARSLEAQKQKQGPTKPTTTKSRKTPARSVLKDK